jgi:hypothetical protein
MSRKQRVDSLAGQVTVAASTHIEIMPPSNVPLELMDLPFWHSIIDAKAKVEWTSHDLEVAAILARTMGQLEKEQKLLRDEGTVIVTERGQPMANPRVAVVHGLHAQVKGYRQSLAIHGRASGEARDVGKKRGIAKNTESALASHEDELDALMN